uniref:AlNc14C358G10970 protein n=1 Tax=Albugo laibachii Nc14 TaxID=890382 RepID=F0WXM0_9STRA|nr:AlNc14C358G10970 [Albugo laibachii Nc14]|eukprot:CCA26214.1 AlNc14C358G10970 [Albugo laibachii Nc14]
MCGKKLKCPIFTIRWRIDVSRHIRVGKGLKRICDLANVVKGSDVEKRDLDAELGPHISEEKLSSRIALVVDENLCREMDQWRLILRLDHREVVS